MQKRSNSYYKGTDLTFTPLTIEEESQLCDRIRKDDMVARAELITAHLRWAASMARRFRGRLELEDAISAANEGLMEALERWDAKKGRFACYAYNFVRGRIFRAIANHPVVPTNVHVMCQRSRIQAARANNECPTTTLGISKSRVAEVESAWDCEWGGRPEDIQDVETSLSEHMDAQQAVKALACLPTRARHILRYRFGLTPMPSGEAPSLIAIGRLLGISRERARQIESASLNTLREHLECATPASE